MLLLPQEDSEQIDVMAGTFAIARPPQLLVAPALGSCVAVALWDTFAKQGAIAHVMLPAPVAKSTADDRFATIVMPKMIDELARRGSPRTHLVAKLAGGSGMFRGESLLDSIGDRNVKEVVRLLEEARITIRARDTGGSHARTAELHLDSGILVVRSFLFGIKEL